jgi:hypothetical protein
MVATSEVKTVLPQANPHVRSGSDHNIEAHRRELPAHGPPAPEGAS